METLLLPTDPKDQLDASVRQAVSLLQQGQVVGIFPEGGISRTGQIQSFKPGIMRVLEGTDVPVFPVYVDQIWGSSWTFASRKHIWDLWRPLRNDIRHRRLPHRTLSKERSEIHWRCRP